MARTDNLTNYLTDIAAAIKQKKGDTSPIKASNFDTEIANLPTGGGGGSTGDMNVDDYFNTSLSYTKDTFLPWYDTSTDYTYLVNEEHTKVIAGVSSSSIILVPIEEKDNYNTRWQITANSSNWRIKNIDLNYYLRIQNGVLRLGTSAANWTNSTTSGKMYCTASYTSYYLMVENDVLSATSTPANGQIFESYKTNGMVMKEDIANSYLIKKYIIKAPTITIPDSITTLAYFCTEYRLLLMPKIIFNDNITALQYMFNNCMNATNIDTSGFNTTNVTNMANMFYYCNALTSLDLSSFETPALTNVSNMFYMCRALKHIDMRNFDFTNVTNYSNMFGASAGDGVPNSCEIIVKDDTAKTWITTNFSRLTGVKTVAEYEGE